MDKYYPQVIFGGNLDNSCPPKSCRVPACAKKGCVVCRAQLCNVQCAVRLLAPPTLFAQTLKLTKTCHSDVIGSQKNHSDVKAYKKLSCFRIFPYLMEIDFSPD